MTVLVTGASGFIGRAFLHEAARRGLSSRAAVRRPPAAPLGADTHVIGEISGETDWSAALDGCDAVLHLAGRAHEARNARDAAAHGRVTREGTRALAAQAAAAGVARFVFISSIKVNGDGRATPYTEADPPSPEGAYARARWDAEQELATVAATHGMAVCVLRIPLVYGPGVRANFLSLLRAVDRGLPLPLAWAGNRRSLLYVRNLADLVMLCFTRREAVTGLHLVADAQPVSTAALVRAMADALGRPARLFPVPAAALTLAAMALGRGGDARRLLGSLTVDTAKIERELGWHPPHDLADGLAATAAWYRGNRADPTAPGAP